MCLYKFGARDSWLNNWEHRGEDMYCLRALLKIPGSGTTLFFFPLRTPLVLLCALGVWDPRECRGDIAFLPSFGPPRRQG